MISSPKKRSHDLRGIVRRMAKRKKLTPEEVLEKNLERNLAKLEEAKTKKPPKQKMAWFKGRYLPVVGKEEFVNDGSFSCPKQGIVKKRTPPKKKPMEPVKKLTVKEAMKLVKKSKEAKKKKSANA